MFSMLGLVKSGYFKLGMVRTV